jgi:hypothetical protein
LGLGAPPATGTVGSRRTSAGTGRPGEPSTLLFRHASDSVTGERQVWT